MIVDALAGKPLGQRFSWAYETPDGRHHLEPAKKPCRTCAALWRESVDFAFTSYGIPWVMRWIHLGSMAARRRSGQRIVEFVQPHRNPAAIDGNAARHCEHRPLASPRERRGRLVQDKSSARASNQTKPASTSCRTRGRSGKIAPSTVDALWPSMNPRYMDRVYHYYLKVGEPRWPKVSQGLPMPKPSFPAGPMCAPWAFVGLGGRESSAGHPRPLLALHASAIARKKSLPARAIPFVGAGLTTSSTSWIPQKCGHHGNRRSAQRAWPPEASRRLPRTSKSLQPRLHQLV